MFNPLVLLEICNQKGNMYKMARLPKKETLYLTAHIIKVLELIFMTLAHLNHFCLEHICLSYFDNI